MATNQSGVILILCSGLALLWSTQSQLIRTANSCDDIICPGGDVQYDCSVPISGSVVVWRMMPECERNGEQPDIIFLFGDPQLSIVCNDRRKITVQGMTTSNGNRFVSTINVTNITSSQTVECLFDDGSQEEIVGNDTVYTTAPVPNVTNIDVTMDLVLITLDQLSLMEDCTLIDYAVSSSTECGMCRSIVDNSISCTNAQVGAGCTVTIETTLCGMHGKVLPIDVTTMAPQLLLTTGPSNTQAASLSSGEVAAIIVVFTLLAVIVVVLIIVAVIYVKEIKGKKIEGTSGVASRKRTEEESILIQLEPKEKEEHQAISNNKLQLEHKDPTIHGEDIATASNIDTGTTRVDTVENVNYEDVQRRLVNKHGQLDGFENVLSTLTVSDTSIGGTSKDILSRGNNVTETGDNEQQNHDRGDSEEVNEYQKNDGESWNQSNDERDSMEPPCDDQTNILEVHGHDKDNERYSEHQNISGRDAVEQVTEVEDNGHQDDDGDAVQDDDDEIRSENLEVFDAVPVEESEKSTAQVTKADDTREKQPTSELLLQGPRLSLASPTRRSTDSVDTHPLHSNDTEATESGDKSYANHPLQVDDGESSLNGSNPLTLVGLHDETPITQPDTYKGNRANIIIPERHCAPSVTRSSEAKMFLSTAEESPEYNPPQKESEHYPSGDLQTITTADPQIISFLKQLLQGQATMIECIKRRDEEVMKKIKHRQLGEIATQALMFN